MSDRKFNFLKILIQLLIATLIVSLISHTENDIILLFMLSLLFILLIFGFNYNKLKIIFN